MKRTIYQQPQSEVVSACLEEIMYGVIHTSESRSADDSDAKGGYLGDDNEDENDGAWGSSIGHTLWDE